MFPLLTNKQQVTWFVRALAAAILFLLLLGLPRGLGPTSQWTHSATPPKEGSLNLSELLCDGKDLEGIITDSSASRAGFPIFRSRKFVIWNNDLHSSPIEDLKHLLSPMGVEIVHFALDSRCDKYFSGCRSEKDIKVLNRTNILNMDDQVIQEFYNTYKDDPEMREVDAFICFHPPPLCEVFLPFNRSILVIASTRYAGGRPETERWTRWNQRLVHLSRSPRHLVAANNLYDIEYMKYYAGVTGELLPSYCGYTNATYRPTRKGAFLLYAGRYRDTKHAKYFREEWDAACGREADNCSGLEVLHIGDAFPGHHSFQDVASYSGIIHIPYQVSTMSLFEQYRMATPLFFPSLRLLATLDSQRDFVNERNCKDFRKCYADTPFASVSRHPSQSASIPDPHNKTSLEAVEYWLKYSDFYQWPHITYFDSAEDLVHKLRTVDLADISQRMKQYNQRVETLLLDKWRNILLNLASFSPNHPG